MDNKFSPLENAKNIIPQIIILHEINSLVSDLFYYLWENAENYHYSPDGKKFYSLDIDDSLRIEFQLDNNNYVRDMHKFLMDLPQLSNHVKNYLILEKINFVYDLYKNNKLGCKYLDTRKKEIINDLSIIYQIRNQIVHNAHIDPIKFFFYTKKAENYCRLLLLTVIDQYNYEKIFKFESLIYRRTYEYTLLYEKLKNEPDYNLFHYLSKN